MAAQSRQDQPADRSMSRSLAADANGSPKSLAFRALCAASCVPKPNDAKTANASVNRRLSRAVDGAFGQAIVRIGPTARQTDTLSHRAAVIRCGPNSRSAALGSRAQGRIPKHSLFCREASRQHGTAPRFDLVPEFSTRQSIRHHVRQFASSVSWSKDRFPPRRPGGQRLPRGDSIPNKAVWHLCWANVRAIRPCRH